MRIVQHPASSTMRHEGFTSVTTMRDAAPKSAAFLVREGFVLPRARKQHHELGDGKVAYRHTHLTRSRVDGHAHMRLVSTHEAIEDDMGLHCNLSLFNR